MSPFLFPSGSSQKRVLFYVIALHVEAQTVATPNGSGFVYQRRGPMDNLLGIWPGEFMDLYAVLQPGGAAAYVTASWSGGSAAPGNNPLQRRVSWSSPRRNPVEVTINPGSLKKKVWIDAPDVGVLTQVEAAAVYPLDAPLIAAYAGVANSYVSTITIQVRRNAMRHAYWNAMCVSDDLISIAAVRAIMRGHEKSNFDSSSAAFDSTIDLWNNNVGQGTVHKTGMPGVSIPNVSAIQADLSAKYSAGLMYGDSDLSKRGGLRPGTARKGDGFGNQTAFVRSIRPIGAHRSR